MSRTKMTVAGVLFASMLGLLIGDHFRMERIDELRRVAERLLPFERDAITAIEIERLRGTVSLQRTDAGWTLTEPIETAADAQVMNEILHALDRQQRIGIQPASEEQMRTFGLVQPPLRVTVASSGGEDVQFDIGEESPVSGEAYAAFTGDNDYFTVSSGLKRNLAREIEALRDKRLIAFNANETTTMTLILKGDSTIRMAREDTEWWLEAPARARADDQAVAAILQAMHLTKAQDFIDTDTLHLERYGLDVPTVVAHFEGPGSPEPRSSTLTVGNPRGPGAKSYYAKRGDRPYVFAIPEGLVFELIPEVDELRARDIFSIAREDIRKFKLEFAGDVIQLRRDDRGIWRFDEPGNNDRADQTMVSEALRYLMTMQVRKYLDYQPTDEMTGLDEPRVKVAIADAKGTLETIETGRTGQTTGTKDIVYARRAPEGEIFGVPIELPGKLFLTREKFMDKSMYAFEPEAVASIRYTVIEPETGQEVAYLFTREEGSWLARAVRTGEQAQVSRNVVESMLLHMRALKWASQLDPGLESEMTIIKSSQLENPQLLLELFDANQEQLTSMGLGPQPDQRYFYLRRDRDDSVGYFAVERNVFLPFAAALRELLRP